jgi:hypothetical protein
LLLVAAASLAPGARSQASLSEWELKAALVYNFARFVEWPEQALPAREAPMVMCLIGRDRFGPAFVALGERQIQGHPIRVRSGIAIEDSAGCHVVFIGELPQRQLVPTLRALSAQPVLTVSDVEGFIDNGGAIGIVPGEQRLQFEVNRTALDAAQLKASSQLLKLARAVLGQGN